VSLDTDQDRISSARLSAAAQKLRSPHISIVQGDPYEELPIAADSVHCIMTSFAVDIGEETLLKEAYRVLRPGGRIYVGTVGFLPHFMPYDISETGRCYLRPAAELRNRPKTDPQ